ncbi:MAG: hypothetical protein QNJ14_08000 [Woeseiaceae bacterium]|nr:hypothetical protein [Woeseiaceae bacterium]
MNRHRVPILALLATTLPVAGLAVAESSIVVAAQETSVAVLPRNARLRLVNLPTVEFGLRAAIRCSGIPVSLTLSVADTFETVDADELQGQRAVKTTLTVPPRQIALAASRNFCIADDDSVNDLLVPGFVTAHASLRCDKDGVPTMHFASAPLQLRLTCERPPAADGQDASAEPSPEDM